MVVLPLQQQCLLKVIKCFLLLKHHQYLHLKCICECFISVNRGFGINQQIVTIVGYAITWLWLYYKKFNTLMNIPKSMTVNNYNRTVWKIIDVVNFVMLFIKGIKIKKKFKSCVGDYQKLTTKPKERRKRTRPKVREMPQLIDCNVMQV